MQGCKRRANAAHHGNDQAAVFSEVLGRPVKYIDVSAEDFIESLKQ